MVTHVLIDMGTRSIHHDVARNVGLHALGHEHTRALLLVVSILVAEISDDLGTTWLISVRAIYALPSTTTNMSSTLQSCCAIRI